MTILNQWGYTGKMERRKLWENWKWKEKKLGFQKIFKSILHEWGHMKINQKTVQKLKFKKTKKKTN